MNFRILFPAFAALSLTATGCSAPAEVVLQPIIGGSQVPDSEMPSVVRLSLAVTSSVWSVCTGTLISPTAILTAAHCVDPTFVAGQLQQPVPSNPVYYYSFSHKAQTKADVVMAKSGEFYDHWALDTPYPGHSNDIGIIHLAQPVTDHAVQRLATSDVVNALRAGQQLLITGYGLRDASDSSSNQVLLKGTDKFGKAGDYEVTTDGTGPQHLCSGDSGGPLFASTSPDIQIGINSRVQSTNCTGQSAYTRVDRYLDWIRQRVPDLEGSPVPDGGAPSDGGMMEDAGRPGQDGGSMDDAGTGTHDAGTSDAGSTTKDGGTGGNQPPPSSPSSGCAMGGTSAAGGGVGLLLVLLLAGLVRRRTA